MPPSPGLFFLLHQQLATPDGPAQQDLDIYIYIGPDRKPCVPPTTTTTHTHTHTRAHTHTHTHTNRRVVRAFNQINKSRPVSLFRRAATSTVLGHHPRLALAERGRRREGGRGGNK